MRMRLLSSACGIVLGLWCRDAWAGDLQVPTPPARWTPQALSTDQYESSPVFSPDGRELMFFRAPPAFDRYRLRMSRCENGQWSEDREPAFSGPGAALETDPALHIDLKNALADRTDALRRGHALSTGTSMRVSTIFSTGTSTRTSRGGTSAASGSPARRRLTWAARGALPRMAKKLPMAMATRLRKDGGVFMGKNQGKKRARNCAQAPRGGRQCYPMAWGGRGCGAIAPAPATMPQAMSSCAP